MASQDTKTLVEKLTDVVDTLNDDQDADDDSTGPDASQELSAIEVEAQRAGWRPQEEWDGDPDKWVDASEFVYRGELMGRISSQTTQIRKQESELTQVKQVIKDLSAHNAKVQETAYKKAMSDLKQQKVDALESDNHAVVVDIDEQMDELRDAKKVADEGTSTPQTSQEVNPLITTWVSKNTWYDTDLGMQGYADGIAKAYRDKHPDHGMDTVLSHVEEEVKKVFPQHFGTNNHISRQTVTEVDEPGNTSTRTQPKKYQARHLNDIQRRVGQRFVDTGAMKSLQEYVEQLADIGELDVQQRG